MSEQNRPYEIVMQVVQVGVIEVGDFISLEFKLKNGQLPRFALPPDIADQLPPLLIEIANRARQMRGPSQQIPARLDAVKNWYIGKTLTPDHVGLIIETQDGMRLGLELSKSAARDIAEALNAAAGPGPEIDKSVRH
jgi:hypothetical protein